jgi:hypothetical protein
MTTGELVLVPVAGASVWLSEGGTDCGTTPLGFTVTE